MCRLTGIHAISVGVQYYATQHLVFEHLNTIYCIYFCTHQSAVFLSTPMAQKAMTEYSALQTKLSDAGPPISQKNAEFLRRHLLQILSDSEVL